MQVGDCTEFALDNVVLVIVVQIVVGAAVDVGVAIV